MGLQRRVQNLAVGGESRQEEPNRRSYHRFGCGAVLGSPLLLPLAILRRAPSPSLAAELGSLRFGRDGSNPKHLLPSQDHSPNLYPYENISGATKHLGATMLPKNCGHSRGNEWMRCDLRKIL